MTYNDEPRILFASPREAWLRACELIRAGEVIYDRMHLESHDVKVAQAEYAILFATVIGPDPEKLGRWRTWGKDQAFRGLRVGWSVTIRRGREKLAIVTGFPERIG